MIEPPVDATTEPIARARRFAALSGPFEPRTLRVVIGDVASNVALAVASDLADSCDTNLPEGRWLMRASARRREIEGLVVSGLLPEAIEWRRSSTFNGIGPDDATLDLLNALAGSSPEAPPTSKEAADGMEAPQLQRIAVALDRAGQRAPAHESLGVVRSALGRKDSDERADAMLKEGFYGRKAELAKIRRWLSQPITKPPVQALFISGLPGIGKSTLIDASVREAVQAVPPWIVIRLDFDRSGLDVQDRVGLTIEITRQISIALGEEAPDLRQARLVAAGGEALSDLDLKGERREHTPDDLARAMADAVKASGRPILVVLDTLEALQSRAATHPKRLFDCLDELCDRGLHPLAVIAAGRGDALDIAKNRAPTKIKLRGLDKPSAEAMLNRLDAPEESYADILEIAEGNPLVLRLAAQAVREAGPEALDSVRRRKGVRAAFLYRFLLSRIGDETLQRLAEPGLVVRRINPDVIAQVLAPKLLGGRLDPQVAVKMFERLSTNHWLVERDPTAPGWVRHRSDIRRVLLGLLYEGDRARMAARIDKAAAAWFAKRTEAFAPLEAAYHALQATRGGEELPNLTPEVCNKFDAATLAELPQPAQDYVRKTRRDRTSEFRGAKAEHAGYSPEELEAAASEIEAILERGDIIEAGYVYERGLAGQELPSTSKAADVAMAYLWRSGRWQQPWRDIRKWVGRGDVRALSPVVALTRLEMLAEFRFAWLVQAMTRDESLLNFAIDLRMRGIKGSLAEGALGFAIADAGGPPISASWSKFDPISASETVWKGGLRDARLIDVLSVPQVQLTARVMSPMRQEAPAPAVDPTDAAGAAAARLLAGMTPYASVAEAVRVRDAGKVGRHLASVDFELAEANGLPPSGAGPWTVAPAVSPDGSVDSVTKLGLLAEWLGSAAFVLRSSDLKLIAHSAERWRRTTAGDWAFETSPEARAPHWARRLDATIADRIAQILALPKPEETAREHLRLWWGGDTTEEAVESAVLGRQTGALRAEIAAASDGPAAGAAERVAVALQIGNVPAAFIPGMAVLLSGNQRKRSRST